MTGSGEKVRAAIDRAETLADDPDAPAGVRAGAGALAMFRGQLESMLPQTDAELDELLLMGARWLYRLRSDEPPEPAAIPGQTTVDEHITEAGAG